MRGSSQDAAREFAAVIQEAVNVLGVAKITLSPGDSRHEFALTVNRDEGLVQGGLHFELRMTIQVVTEHGEGAIRTRSYQYSLQERDREDAREVLEYHWGPDQPPHVHVNGGKDHVPTGRVLVEDVIEYCIAEAGWPPRHSDWKSTLTGTRGHFQINRHWE